MKTDRMTAFADGAVGNDWNDKPSLIGYFAGTPLALIQPLAAVGSALSLLPSGSSLIDGSNCDFIGVTDREISTVHQNGASDAEIMRLPKESPTSAEVLMNIQLDQGFRLSGQGGVISYAESIDHSIDNDVVLGALRREALLDHNHASQGFAMIVDAICLVERDQCAQVRRRTEFANFR